MKDTSRFLINDIRGASIGEHLGSVEFFIAGESLQRSKWMMAGEYRQENTPDDKLLPKLNRGVVFPWIVIVARGRTFSWRYPSLV